MICYRKFKFQNQHQKKLVTLNIKTKQMKLFELLPILEKLAPLSYAEDFDNVGLLVGDKNQTITGVLICHDALKATINEAIEKKCNVVVCFHPIIFNGMKKITGKNYVEQAVIHAIKNDIAIYALHTALDNHQKGVNKILCDRLGLEQTKILIPKEQYIYKLSTYCPEEQTPIVLKALYDAGAGAIGTYTNCSFTSKGIGQFTPGENSNPFTGKINQSEEVAENKIEVVLEKHLKDTVLKALINAHPYEEVAYEITETLNKHQNIGLGMIGYLKEPLSETDFLNKIKECVPTPALRHSSFTNKPIYKVAVLGGSGSFAIPSAKAQQADAYVTSDLKYHDFFQAENTLLLADVGHYESEAFVKKYIYEYLSKKILTFAIILSQTNTNPVNYL